MRVGGAADGIKEVSTPHLNAAGARRNMVADGGLGSEAIGRLAVGGCPYAGEGA